MILNAVLCVWNEEDIIESTVKHLFAQGCSNVFVVDNASTDKTIKNAIKAGAKLAATFETKYFSEDQKIVHLNTVVRHINEITNEDQIWWLYVDADEFPHIDCGPILDTLKSLDSNIRALHGYMLDHIPTHPPYHVQGYHPIDFQPLCEQSSSSKICLLRYDKGKKHLWSVGGAHDFITHDDSIQLIRNILQIHHFPYRNPEYTFKRLKKLVDRNAEGMRSGDWHKEFSRQIAKSTLTGYELRYNQLHSLYCKNKHRELKTRSLPYDYKSIIRWYDANSHETKKSEIYEDNIWRAMHYFFTREYEIALCKFNDALNACNDATVIPWIMVKIAECLLHTDSNDANTIISSVKKHKDKELNFYIDKYMRNDFHENESPTGMRGKAELYRSEFAPGVQDRYEKMTIKIENNVSRTINRGMRSHL